MGLVQSVDGNGYAVVLQDDAAVASVGDSDFDSIYNNNTRTLEDIFQDVASEYDVPVDLLKAVAEAESGFDPDAVSSCGASGIMQLMPETAKGLGVDDVFDPEQNITGGAKMLAYLLDDYDGDTTLALAAYNAGSGAVAKYGGVPPYEETNNYIKRINSILDGGLEKDLSYIQVGTGKTDDGASASDTVVKGAQGIAGTTRIHGQNIPVRVVDSDSSDGELFSYDDYLKFVEVYLKLLDELMDEGGSDEDAAQDESTVSEQQRLYEQQTAQYGVRLNSLFK
jgi:hypothetical protein